MKRFIVGFFAGLLVATAGAAGAIATRRIHLHAGDQATFAGVQCGAVVPSGGSRYLNCVSDWKFGLLYSSRELEVFRINDQGAKLVFKRTR